MAYLPFGHPTVELDKKTGKVVDSYFAYRDKVIKKGGAAVPTDPFLDPKYEGITGVLHSAVDPVNRPPEMGGDFWFLHNPLARIPFRESPFHFFRQYFYEERSLRTIEANE